MSLNGLPAVEHHRYGRGVIKETRHRGLEFRVAFESGLELWVRREDVRTLQSPRPKPSRVPPAVALPHPLKERAMIEALRLGIVPYERVNEFTFGRNREVAHLQTWLAAPEATLLIVGEYGAGKTHLLEYVHAMALREGFGVALAELDANEAPFHRPKRVYRKLLASFRYCDESGRIRDFRAFMRDVALRGHKPLESHHFLGPVLDMLRRGGNEEAIWQWIEGQESVLRPVLYDHGTAANIYCNILTALGWSAATILDRRGLVLLFDEAEVIDVLTTSAQVGTGENVVRGLMAAARSAPELLTENTNWCWGNLSHLRYHGRTLARFLYKNPSHTKVIMAFTPTLALDSPLLGEAGRLPVEELPTHALREAFRHVCQLYKQAYGFAVDAEAFNVVFSIIVRDHGASTRRFIKAAVEALDLLRFHGSSCIQEMLQ